MSQLIQQLTPYFEGKKIKPTSGIDQLVQLPGDASTRKYYRVSAKGKKNSYILMKMEGFQEQSEKLPFLEIQKHLTQAGVDVPTVLEFDPAQGLILLEDLGDVTLLKKLQSVTSSEVERHLYQNVIDDLVQLHYYATPRKGAKEHPTLHAYSLRFDFEKLMWEVNFTIEHFYETYLSRKLSPADKKCLEKGFEKICKYLDQLPTVFTHRDFHSRNIMVTDKPERFVMIDFQDARMGPAQYDLASLLKDSYYQLEESQIARLVDYYIARWEAVSGERLDHEKFIYGFDMMSVQRNFKAIGSFASFLNKRGNATYLKYIGNTFENIRRNLLKYPEFSDLRETLFHYYYF